MFISVVSAIHTINPGHTSTFCFPNGLEKPYFPAKVVDTST